MSYEIYKVLHLTGLVLLFSGLATLVTAKVSAIKLEGASRKFSLIAHGLGLLLLIVSGFGLLARLGIVNGLPNWVYFKILAWIFFGGIIAVLKRKNVGWKFYSVLICIFILTAYVAINKPF